MNSLHDSLPIGRGITTYLNNKIKYLWPDLRGLSLLTFGKCLWNFTDLSKPNDHIHGFFPHKYYSCLTLHFVSNTQSCYLTYNRFPFQKCSFDRIIYHHDLSISIYQFNQILRSCWETLKDDGKIVLILPNKLKWWGLFNFYSFYHTQKNSFLMYQLKDILKEHMFEVLYYEKILYFPPKMMNSFSLYTNKLLEFTGHFFIPFGGSYHLIEIRKNLYAPINITPIPHQSFLKQNLSKPGWNPKNSFKNTH